MLATENDDVVLGGSFSAHVALVKDVQFQAVFEIASTPSDTDEDAFVGMVDSDGNAKWLWSSGGTLDNETIHDVAVVGDYVVAVGTMGPGTFNFAGKVIGDTSNTNDAGFVLVFDATTGEPVDGESWSCLFANATGIATTPDGGIWVVGTYTGAGCIVFDDQLTFVDGGTYPYIARLELDTGSSPVLAVPDGVAVTVESFGGSSKAIVESGLSVVSSGDGVVIAGTFRNNSSDGIDFGGGHVVSNTTSLFRPFLVGFDAEGSRWVRDIDGGGDITIHQLVSDAVGNIVVVGDLESGGSITESPFNYTNNDNNLDGFLMKLAAVDGADVLWGLGSSTSDEDHLESVAVSPTGRLWGVGWGVSLSMWGAPTHPDLTDYNIVLFDVTP